MEMFYESEEYKQMKRQYERTCFKLIGKYCINTGDKLVEKSAAEIHEYFKNKKVTVEYNEQQTTKKGTTVTTTKEMSKNFYQIWSEDPEMNEYLEVVFNCDVKNVLSSQYNLFDGFVHFNDLQSETVDLSPIFEHMRSLVNYNEEHFEYVLNWLAQLVQQPHILPHTTLIFISEEGVGKDLFSRFISNVINDKYTHNTEKLENICGKFNSILGGKLLITINETNPIESRERMENIKFIITADKITIEGKHKDPIKADNFCRFIFFSNRLFAFPVENGSRRPVIFKASDKYLPINFGTEANKKYFTNLADNIYANKKYQKAFLEFLQNRNIANFNPKDITKSELHQELEENSISPIVHYLAYLVKGADINFRLSTTECYKRYNEYIKENGYKYECSQNKFIVEMTSLYKIKKIKSNGYMHFEFDIAEIKALLTKQYKISFDPNNEDNNEETNENPLDTGLSEQIDYKKMFEQQQKEMEELKKQLAKLKSKPIEEPINKISIIEQLELLEVPKFKQIKNKKSKEIKTEQNNVVEDQDLDDIVNFVETKVTKKQNKKTIKISFE